MKVARKTRSLDSVDLAHLDDTLRSAGYAMMRADLDADVETVRKRLEDPEATETELRLAQGELRGLRKALRRPEELRRRLLDQERDKPHG
jgi:hypothetical protein